MSSYYTGIYEHLCICASIYAQCTHHTLTLPRCFNYFCCTFIKAIVGIIISCKHRYTHEHNIYRILLKLSMFLSCFPQEDYEKKVWLHVYTVAHNPPVENSSKTYSTWVKCDRSYGSKWNQFDKWSHFRHWKNYWVVNFYMLSDKRHMNVTNYHS